MVCFSSYHTVSSAVKVSLLLKTVDRLAQNAKIVFLHFKSLE